MSSSFSALRKSSALTVFLLLALVVLFEAWFLELRWDGPWAHQSDGSLAQEYTRALAHGQSYLMTPPDPRVLASPEPLRSPFLLQDATLHQGRYYLYFSVVPFVALPVPWLLLTGTYLSPAAAILIFSVLGYIGYGGALLAVSRRCLARESAFLTGLIFCGLVACSGAWPLMAEPEIYEVESAAAYAFFAWALLLLIRAELSRERGYALAGAGGFAGLALACRPDYLPAAAAVAAYILWRRWSAAGSWPARAARSIPPLLPLIVILLGIAAWNMCRFGNPLNFGARQLYHEDGSNVLVPMSVRNIPYHLHRYLFGGAWLDRYFPFFQGEKPGPFALAEHQTASDWLYGLILSSPMVLGCLLIPFEWSRLRDRGLSMVAAILAIGGAGILLFLCIIPGSSFRYPADFLGLFAFLAGLGVLAIDPLRTAWRRWLIIPLLGAAVVGSVLGTTFVLCSIAQIRLHYDVIRPAELSRMARVFNAVVYRAERVLHSGPKGITLDLRFPVKKFGAVEPLVVAGRPSEQDFLYAYYTGPGTIQFGFESMGHGGPVTGPVAMDYHAPHHLEVFFGSLLPPDGSPLLRQLPPEEVAAARRTVCIILDGDVVMESEVTFHPTRGQLFIGTSPYDAAFGRKFTGEMLEAGRPLLKDAYFHPGWTAALFGPAALKLALQPEPEHLVVPIISIGYRPAGSVLALEYLGANQVRWVWARSGQAPVLSPPFAWVFGVTHNVEVASGSLLPPTRSPLWLQVDRAEISARKAAITCRIDGRLVFEFRGKVPDASPREVFFGRNMAGISGIADRLPSPVTVTRESW